MTEPSLYDCRKRLQSLSTEDGTFSIRCARTGEQPHPVAGKRFESRKIATTAVAVAEEYRRLLRTYDTSVIWHDLIVCEDHPQERRRSAQSAVRTSGSAVTHSDRGRENSKEWHSDPSDRDRS